MTALPGATGPRPAAGGPRDAPRHAAQVVRRVLLRRNIVIDAETAQLIVAAVQAALQTGAPSRRPNRGPSAPAAGCEPLSENGSSPGRAGKAPPCSLLHIGMF